MTRAVRRVPKREVTRNYSIEPAPVDEFDADPVTKPIPVETMAMLVAMVRQ